MEELDDLGREMLRDSIFETIENQIRDGTPPKTKATLDRLMKEGYDKEAAMKLIGCVLTTEMFEVLHEGRNYDEGKYVRALKLLPNLPWDDEEDEAASNSGSKSSQ